MKNYKVVAKSMTMDAEINCNDYPYDARHYFESFIKSGAYSKVYIMDNRTGELYDTYDKSLEANGIKEVFWSSLAVS
jgi:hypothetical protein